MTCREIFLMKNILLLNGPNLNLLGKREPDIYGTESLESITDGLVIEAEKLGLELISFQSNAEHELVDKIQTAPELGVQFILINPGALTHTSVSLRDALLGVGVPIIEVHLSNVYSRESFRQHSYLSDVALGVITGFGSQGYSFALHAASSFLCHGED